jgi:hypothetical protein
MSTASSMASSSKKLTSKSEGLDACHYHIRWGSSALDWEAFCSKREAEGSAEALARPGETYTIEKFGGDCPPCAELLLRRSQQQGRTGDATADS